MACALVSQRDNSGAAVSSTPQWLGRGFASTGDLKKVYDLSPESSGQLFKYGNCGIFQATLKAADVGAINLGIDRQDFLRKSATDP